MMERCFICGEDNPNVLERHHIVPRRHGGSDDPENMVRLCANCHRAIERMYNSRFYRKLDLLDSSSVPDVECEEESAKEVVSSFAEVCLEYRPHGSVKRIVVRDTFNGYLDEKGHGLWNFDDHGTVARFGRLVKEFVPDDVEQTTKQGECADKNLVLTDAGEKYYQSQRVE